MGLFKRRGKDNSQSDNAQAGQGGNPYQQNGYGYPQNGYGYGGYGGYPGYGYPNGAPQGGQQDMQNGYAQNGYPGYGYGGYGGYPGYGYGGYGGYPGYGYGGYGGYAPMSNYIAESYPQEDYGNPYATDAQQQAQDENSMANTQKTQTQGQKPANNTQTNAAPQEPVSAPAPEATQPQQAQQPAQQPAQAAQAQQPAQPEAAAPAQEPQPQQAQQQQAQQQQQQAAPPQQVPPGESEASQFVDVDLSKFQGDEALKAEAEDLKRKWYAVTAEYENYRKRTQNTRVEAYKEGRADVIKKLFPIGDNLDRAIKSCQDENTKKGIEMVLNAFDKLLESEEIVVINPIGQPFDPKECEAIMAMDPQEGQESGIVLEVYVKGYKQGDKVLRYAQVIVTK